MNILEGALSWLAPHPCLGCGSEKGLICRWCQPDLLGVVASHCYRCKTQTREWQTCGRCRRYGPRRVFIATLYDGAAKDLVKRLKFSRAQAAAQFMSGHMCQSAPWVPEDTLVTYVPTASRRRRLRGYDQAALLAKGFAKRRQLTYARLLARRGQSRQVGADRARRLEQLQDAFWVPRPSAVAGRPILLVDDIMTTGGSLQAATSALKLAGAASVSAAVFAERL